MSTHGFPAIRIRKAIRDDADCLTRIALAAKRHWGYPEKWIEHWREMLTIRPEDVDAKEIYCADLGEGIVGFCGLCTKASRAQLEHLWVWPEMMGRGVGRALFHHAAARAKALGFHAVEVESDPNAAGFYERMGARRTGANTTKLDGQRRELPLLVYEIAP